MKCQNCARLPDFQNGIISEAINKCGNSKKKSTLESFCYSNINCLSFGIIFIITKSIAI